MLKFVFEEQDYQKEAVNAVTGLFMSEPRDDADYSSHTGIIGNRLLSSGADIQKSLDMIQSSLIQSSKISEKTTIESQGMDFTVEMETGTGKTYVYIRTILELARLYGWRKYIIVVPSLPIKEGVLKTFQMTREHFRTLPDLVSYNEREYDFLHLSPNMDISFVVLWNEFHHHRFLFLIRSYGIFILFSIWKSSYILHQIFYQVWSLLFFHNFLVCL